MRDLGLCFTNPVGTGGVLEMCFGCGGVGGVLMSVVVNVMLSLMSVMSPPPALCNLSVRTAVKLCILGVLALGVSLVS